MTIGKMISIEGIDGAGKSSNVKFIANYLRLHDFTVVETRDPGGTEFGETIRQTARSAKVSPKTELLLYSTIRQQLVDEIIRPSIEEGKIVISDRFCDSTYAYQARGRGLMKEVAYLEPFIGEGLLPDYTLLLDITVEESIKRLKAAKPNEPADRFDGAGESFKRMLYDAYQERARMQSERVVSIKANGSLNEVQQELKQWMNQVFIPNNKHLRFQKS